MKQAVILAAGEGQRLRPFTANRPKVMMKIAGKPILHHVVEALRKNGFEDIVIICGYKKEQIYDYFDAREDLAAGIRYIEQDKQLGTAHALNCAKDILNEKFLVLPGDNLITEETIQEISCGGDWIMLVSKQDNPLKSIVVDMEKGFVKAPAKYEGLKDDPTKETGIQFVNTGIFCFDKRIFNYTSSELDIPDALNSAIKDGVKIKTVLTEKPWFDMVYSWDILRINSLVQVNTKDGISGVLGENVVISGKVSIGEGTCIHPNCYIKGPAMIGEGCEIGPNTCIMPSTSIGDNTTVGAFTEIDNCVIGSDVLIGSGTYMQDSVVDDGCRIDKKCFLCSDEVEVRINGSKYLGRVGTMMGANCVLGCGVSAEAGTLVGNKVKVKPFKQLKGALPDESIVI